METEILKALKERKNNPGAILILWPERIEKMTFVQWLKYGSK